MHYKIIITEPEAIKDDSSTLTQITKKQQEINKLQIPKPKRKQTKKRKRKNQDEDLLDETRKMRKIPKPNENEEKTIKENNANLEKGGNDDQTKERRETDRKVTIQTTEGQYETTLIVDNSNNCPIQQKLGLTRYRILEPPRMMRNIPKYYTTRNLPAGQTLKFDIRNPDPGRQLWNRTNRTQWNENRDETQECIIETAQEIQARESKTAARGKLKRTIQHEQPRENRNGSTCKKRKI